MLDEKSILAIFDKCNSDNKFPMLDNGYVYLAACRLSLHRSDSNWAMVIEVFGYSPRARLPYISIETFAAMLHDRDRSQNYVTREAYERYLANNPHNEFRAVFPLEEGAWLDSDDNEFLAQDANEFVLRGRPCRLPGLAAYSERGVGLENPGRVSVAEFCRWLASAEREAVLASPAERRVSLLPGMQQLLQLEAWNHPDLAGGEVVGNSETFQQLARVLATGDPSHYAPSKKPNTHWTNWPDGGTL
jgi:hypothetical protein